MKRLGNVVKWVVIGLFVAEWYARTGRDFLFGEDLGEWGIGETIRTWVELPLGAEPNNVPGPISNSDGDEIGWMHEVRPKEATDMAGHPAAVFEVFTEVEADKVGRPINVALSEIDMLVRDAIRH